MASELILAGCTPEPLMGYLKALGVFRLLAEQKDHGVRACWRNDTFALHTILERDALVRFFLEEYNPTPVVAPWNGGSGFHEKDNRQAMDIILASEDPRLDDYRDVIRQAQQLVKPLISTRKDSKEQVLAGCRNVLSDKVLSWLDASFVLSSAGPKYPPLLGTGGNDGRLEFSNNFMQNLVSALGLGDSAGRRSKRAGDAAQGSRGLIEAALFGEASSSLIKDRTAGQFSPGSVGGPNATVGFEADSLTNPWDYVLMIEGALSFAGAVARRLSAESHAKAIFPFTADTSAAGYGTAVDTEYAEASRGELWVPLWSQPTTYPEVAHVFAEGRAQVGPRQAATGTDFARAIAGLGVERGISQFVRFGFLRRSGLAFLATPLGRFRVRTNPMVDVLVDVDPWLNGLRRLARSKNAPEALSRLLRHIDQAIMDFCQVQDGELKAESARRLQDVLIALGGAESWLARSGLRDRQRPLSGLRPDWLKQVDDGSPEFRIAAALASIQSDRDGAIGPLRANLESVEMKQGWWQWAERNPSVVWQHRGLLQDMGAVVERRCLEARMGSDEAALPLQGRLSVPLGDVQVFLEGRLDDRRISDLVLPITAIRWQDITGEMWVTGGQREAELLLPLPYAVLKLLFLPWKIRPHPGAQEVETKLEPSILPLLRASRASEAYQAACRRLHVSGLIPLVSVATVPPHLARRLAAALLIPISYQSMYALADMALMSISGSP